MHRTGWLLLTGLACVAFAPACGPSFTALYEGDARFEHCYALDDSGQESMQKRADCWRDWMDHYTFGQTRDRVQYANNRYKALTSAALPTDEGMMSAAGVDTSTTPQLAPTNAFAPPPTTAAATPSSNAPSANWMSNAPQAVEPMPGDAGLPRTASPDGGAGEVTPAPTASAIDPTILPPKKTKPKAKK